MVAVALVAVEEEAVEREVKAAMAATLALSTTAACASSEKKPSHVILALGHPADYAASTIRIGLGKDLTLETIDKVVEILSSARTKLAEKEGAND